MQEPHDLPTRPAASSSGTSGAGAGRSSVGSGAAAADSDRGSGAAATRDVGFAPDRRIRALAADQHGVVARRQLLAAGVSSDQIGARRRAGLLVPLHRGVYRVGPGSSPWAPFMAAVLACGPDAVLSHGSAAALWGLRGHPGPLEVSLRSGDRRPRGIRVHRTRALDPADVTRLDRIPVTTPARTILDLAAVLPPRELERVVAEAFVRRLTTETGVRRMLDRNPGRRGNRALARLVRGPAFTRSEAESRLLELVRAAGLPEPETNVRVLAFEVDMFWRASRLIVEVDGYAYHRSRRAFEEDRRRDAILTASGYSVQRVTWNDLEHDPLGVVARIAAALALGKGGGGR